MTKTSTVNDQKSAPAQQALQQLADEYVNFEIDGKRVRIPYILGHGRFQFWRTSGKGTPDTIRKEVRAMARREGFSLINATGIEITRFMRQHRIGIDCSGLAYHLLNAYCYQIYRQPLGRFLYRHHGILGVAEKAMLSYQRHRRINASTLTSSLNSTTVSRAQDIRIGDLVRMHGERDHVLVVTHVSDTTITYIHSSSKSTRKQGPHYGAITIIDPTLGLEHQQWHELTKDGKNYGQTFFRPTEGDSVRRLNVLK